MTDKEGRMAMATFHQGVASNSAVSVKAQNGHSLRIFTRSTLHFTMITLLVGFSDKQEKRRSGTKNIYLPKEMGPRSRRQQQKWRKLAKI